MSRVNKASAAVAVNLGLITGLVKPKLEKSLYSHSAYRLSINNKIGRVKLSPRVVDRWASESLFLKNERIFLCL